MMALASSKVHPIYYYYAYFSIRFDIKNYGHGLDAIKTQDKQIAEKRKNNEA